MLKGKGRNKELYVGIFVLLGILSIVFLAFTTSGFGGMKSSSSIIVYAYFDNIGDLKVRAPIVISGVHVGEVSDISLDRNTFKANVSMAIDKHINLPFDTTASILTSGIVGSNYISLSPGFSDIIIHNKDTISDTNSAIILENMIGQMMYNKKSDNK